MSLQLSFFPRELQFRFEAGTSRGVLTSKTTYIFEISDTQNPGFAGKGEAGPLPGLSRDATESFAFILPKLVSDFNNLRLSDSGWETEEIISRLVPAGFPALQFGLEMALLDFQNGCRQIYFDNEFSRGSQSIEINGLVWMGDPGFMAEQIEEKLDAGFSTIKMKVGAISFDQECRLLESIRSRFTPEEITLRVDANGAFDPMEAPEKLARLSDFSLHSIEQPVKPRQPEVMARLCRDSPVPVALDEELIGIDATSSKRQLLETIRPQFIVLKPTLLGGFEQTKEWIAIAETLDIRWWITSALESNIGLNAIAQFTAEYNNPLPQGLGTGQLYSNNFESALEVKSGRIYLIDGKRSA